jgi:hypothetical protein
MQFHKILTASTLLLTALVAPATIAMAQNGDQSQSPTVGKYISTDPLAGVRYDNRYDVSLGAAYVRFMPGPNSVYGSDIGGLDGAGSFWLTRNLGIEGNVRYYLGTAGAPVNAYHINGPFVSQTIFVGGPEWLGPHNKHGAFIAHALFGGAYGNFDQNLRGVPTSNLGFYANGLAPAGVLGGHIDLNRSPRWVFRISPDCLWTRYKTVASTDPAYPDKVPIGSFNNFNFAISVGMEYKFKAKR